MTEATTSHPSAPRAPRPTDTYRRATVVAREIINTHLVRSGREGIPDDVSDRTFALVLDAMGVASAATLGFVWSVKGAFLSNKPEGAVGEKRSTAQFIEGVGRVLKERDRDARRSRQPLRSVFPSAPPAVSEGASPTDRTTEGAE